MSSPIQFGTDGWRAVIDKEFTPQNVEAVIQAFCDVRLKADPNQKKVVLGYDRRFQSPESAVLAGVVLAGNGFTVLFSDQFCPTPCVSWMVKSTTAFAGIMITASHNPWQWNGIKFKEDYGGSAAPEYTQKIENQIVENQAQKRGVQKLPFSESTNKKLIIPFSPHKDYVHQLRSLVDISAIQKAGLKILNDPLFGAGTHFIKKALMMETGEMHTEADIRFGGLNPEPIDKNLADLMSRMKTGEWDVGLATDGDADRIGAVDEEGNFVNSHQIFALLLKHYVENKNLRGAVIKSVSTTQMINLLCRKYGLECIETPIGFKHICKILREKNAMMGGEESGGISFAPHVHERDGILNALFLLELMAVSGKKLGELIRNLYADIGPFYFERHDLHLEKPQIELMQNKLRHTPIDTLNNMSVAETNTMDGFKYILKDSSWLLIRASGTEPLVRIYAEGGSPEKVKELIGAGLKLISKPL